MEDKKAVLDNNLYVVSKDSFENALAQIQLLNLGVAFTTGGLDYTMVVRRGEIIDISGDEENVDGGPINDVREYDVALIVRIPICNILFVDFEFYVGFIGCDASN